MIILVTGWFSQYDSNGYPTGKKEFLVSHGYDTITDRTVILPCEPPNRFPGARFNAELGEWVID